MKHLIITLTIVLMASTSFAAPVAEKVYLQEKIMRMQLQVQALSRQIKEDQGRLKDILKEEAAQQKAMEEHEKTKEVEPTDNE